MNFFCYLSTSAKTYQESMSEKLSEVDKEICDLLHYIELYDLTNEEGLKAIDLLKEASQHAFAFDGWYWNNYCKDQGL